MRDRPISSVAGGLLAGLVTVPALASPSAAPAQPAAPGRSIAWRSVDPPGTRITGLAVSRGTPQVVYASTRVGVLRSDDGGTGWRLLPGSPGGDAVAVHPETAEIVLVGSGSGGLPGRGVFRSTDGGATWERTLSNRTEILRIAPTDPSVVYALGLEGLARSFDGGLSWEPFGEVFLPESLAVDPSDPATIYVGTTTRLFRSIDSGDTFEERDEGLRGSFLTIVAVGPSDPEVLYAGTRDGIFRSLDAGASWVSANGAEDAGDEGGVRVTGEVVALAVDPRDAGTVLAATSSAVFRTTDGGDTWEDLLDGRFRGLQDLVVDIQEPQRTSSLPTPACRRGRFFRSCRTPQYGAPSMRWWRATVRTPARTSAPRGAPSAETSLLPGLPGRWPPGSAVPACGRAPRAVSWPWKAVRRARTTPPHSVSTGTASWSVSSGGTFRAAAGPAAVFR